MGLGFLLHMPIIIQALYDGVWLEPRPPWDWILDALALGPGLMLLIIGAMLCGYSSARQEISEDEEMN